MYYGMLKKERKKKVRMSEWIKNQKKNYNKIKLSQVDKTSLYLCIIEREVEDKETNWIELNWIELK